MILTAQVQKGFSRNLKHPDLFRYFLVEYLQYRDKGVSHATPALHFLHDCQHQIHTVQAPAAEAFYFEKLIFHVVNRYFGFYLFGDFCLQNINLHVKCTH